MDMTRSEYLMALYDALNDIPGNERTDIISEYQEYFKSEMEKGRTEDEICTSLGDPVTLAYAIRQRRGYGKFANKPSPRRGPSGFFKLAKIIVGVIIGMGIFTLFGLGANKELGWESINIGLGEVYEVNEEKEMDLGSVDNIEISVISSDTRVVVYDGNKVQATLKGTVRTTNKNAVPKLVITRNGNKILIEERSLEMSNIGAYSGNTKMDILIPRDFKGSLAFEAASACFTSSDLDIESFSIDVTSGDIKLEDVELDKILKIVTTAGCVDISRLKAKEASLETISGDKTLNDFEIDGTVSLMSTSGYSHINGLNCRNLVINSLSGDIELDRLKGGVQLETTSGLVRLDMAKVTDRIEINSLSGDVELKIPSDTGFTLDCEVNSGDIACDFDLKNISFDKWSLHGSNGNGKIPVNITTTSGDINIKK
jgi:DUF4097 and DUF4098 domain-containing protein YvlB